MTDKYTPKAVEDLRIFVYQLTEYNEDKYLNTTAMIKCATNVLAAFDQEIEK